MPSDLYGKFRCKDDFLKYLREQGKYLLRVTLVWLAQMYVPPKLMVNKDFLKQILAGTKKLYHLNEIKPVHVPQYDELSVKRLWPNLKRANDFMIFLPDELPKGRLPDRDYFFTVLNTLNEEYVAHIINEAGKTRFSGDGEKNKNETILMSNEIGNMLMEKPFVSGK